MPLDEEAVEAMTRLLRELSDDARLRELYARRYDATTPRDSTIGFTYAELCQRVDDYEQAFSIYAELCELVEKKLVSEPLGKCIEEARVNGVDESRLREAASLWLTVSPN